MIQQQVPTVVCVHNCIDAVRRNPASCRAVDAEIENATKDWLHFALDREGGRQRRAARKAARSSI